MASESVAQVRAALAAVGDAPLFGSEPSPELADQVHLVVSVSASPLTDNTLRRRLDRELRQFQTKSAAWVVADALLRLEPSPMNEHALFYGAQTIVEKLERDFDDLDPALLPSLRDMLFDRMAALMRGPPSVFRQVCVAIAALAVQWQAWEGVIPSIVAHFQGGEAAMPADAVPVVLQIITRLPEEAASRSMIVPDDVRRAKQEELERNAPETMAFLEGCLEVALKTRNRDQLRAVLECLRSWIADSNIPSSKLATSPLLATAVEMCADPELHEVASRTIKEILSAYYRTDRHELLLGELIPRVLDLGDAFARAAPGAGGGGGGGGGAGGGGGEDEELARSLCSVFVALGENQFEYLTMPVEADQMRALALLLQCTGTPKFEVSEQTIKFWRDFADHCAGLQVHIGDPGFPGLADVFEDRLHPTFQRLIGMVLAALEFPEDFDEFPDDRKNDFRHHFRYRIADLLQTACVILGGRTVLAGLAEQVGGQWDTFQTTHGAGRVLAPVEGGPERLVGTAHGLEAALYAVRTIASHVREDEDEFLGAVLALVPQLPVDHPELRATGCRLVGRYAFWIDRHVEALDPLLTFVGTALAEPGAPFVEQASVATKDLLEHCGAHLGAAVIPRILPLVRLIGTPQGAHVMVGLGALARQCPDRDEAGRLFVEVLEPNVTRLRALADNPREAMHAAAAEYEERQSAMRGGGSGGGSGGDGGGRSSGSRGGSGSGSGSSRLSPEDAAVAEVIHNVKLAAGVLEGSRDSEAVHGIVPHIWEILSSLLDAFREQESVVEAIMQFHIAAIKHCPRAYRPYLGPFLESLADRYEARPVASYLYAARKSVGQFSREMDEEAQGSLLAFLTRVAPVTFRLLSGDSVRPFEENPGTVEDFFALLHKVVLELPALIGTWMFLQPALDCALTSLNVDHHLSNTTVLLFVKEVVRVICPMTPNPAVSLEEVRETYGPFVARNFVAIVQAVMRGVSGGLPSNLIDDEEGSFSTLICALRDFNPHMLFDALQGFARTVPPEAISEPDAKAIILGIMDASKVSDVDDALFRWNGAFRRYRRRLER